MDQVAGSYTVNFSLQMIGGNTDNGDAEICTVRVSEMWGKKIHSEQVIRVKDLDENGCIDVTINYRVGNTGGVEYLVFCRDGMEMYVNSISWRKVPAADTWSEYSSEGLLLRERYFTAEGDPLIQSAGHYGVKYEYEKGNAQWIGCQYLDADGKTLKTITFGYAQINRRYNNLGKILEERYLDVDGELCLNTSNYAHYRRAYDQRGNVLTVNYYDTEDKLVCVSSGYAAVEYRYDNDNNRIYERYLDEKNEPVILNSGYAEIHRQYDDKNRVILESYYGVDGEPIALSKNQAIVAYEYDKDDNITCWKYMDENGDPVMLTDGYAELHRIYNDKKWIVEEYYFDTKGELVLRPSGYAVVRRDFDNVGNIICEQYQDTYEQPVCITNGYAEIHKRYDGNNRVCYEAYFDTDGSPLALSKNQAAVEYGYDEMGNTVLVRYFDTNGESVLLTDNYSELRRVYSSGKKLIEESYYDTNGRPSDIYGRYTRFENKYDDNDNLSLTYFTNAVGEPVQCGSSYFHEYLQSLKDRDITIFISVKDEGTKSLTDVLHTDLKEIGVTTDLSDKFHNSFYAVITPEGSVEDYSDTETISYNGKIGEVPYSVVSGGWYIGNTSSIIINGEEYSKNTRGMNFVIVDNKTGEVIDSVAFDTYDFEMRVTR